ncbi:GHMP kinase [Stappia sp.]|uniref:GHMP family kinase ATP-binding protein n=1 Tax=Stappia sp. TaxID=1870903 RepID=UPI003A9A4F9F
MFASATAIAHHGEIIQGTFHDAAGRLHRGLVTLPFTPKHTTAFAQLTENCGSISVQPPSKTKALGAVRLLLKDRGYTGSGLQIVLRSNIPYGFGLGSSTADIIAGLNATARLLKFPLKKRDLFKIAVRAEQASDGTMFLKRPRMVCQREGEVLERFKNSLPPFSLISVNADPDNPVDTLKYPPARYRRDEIAEFDALRGRLRTALGKRDLRLLGEISTRSAIINQRYLPQPHFEDILMIARNAKAAGVQVAHSGRMIGIMLPPDAHYTHKCVRTIQADLLALGLFPEFHRTPHPFEG